MLYYSFMVCLVEMTLEGERERMVGRGIQLGGEGGEKTGGSQVFSPQAHQNPISPNQRDYRRENKVALLLVAFGQIYPNINVRDVLVLLDSFFLWVFFWTFPYSFFPFFFFFFWWVLICLFSHNFLLGFFFFQKKILG